MELQSFSIILIIFLMSDSLAESPEAVFKYFVISSITGLLYLFGYYFSNFELNENLGNGSMLHRNNLNLFIMSLPFIIKLGMFPSYTWMPEVYRGLSYLGVAFLSLVPKITSFLVLLKFLGPSQLFLVIGIGSLIIGSFGGLNQSNLKVLVSFSSIGHFGLIFVLISLGYNFLNLSSFYLIIYCLTASSILFTLSNLKKNNIIELGGFLSHSSVLGLTLGILLLSLMGFPPLSGFICKLLVIISSLLQSTNSLAIITMILSLVVSAFYYLRAFTISSNSTESCYQCYSLISEKVKLPQFCYPVLVI
jgi:NADH:ubiquinone oxidoreductase subunit 2 (subunit N)